MIKAYWLIFAVVLQGPIMYKVLGDSIAPYYFSVNETTGVISLKEDLKSDTNDKYQVCFEHYYPFLH